MTAYHVAQPGRSPFGEDARERTVVLATDLSSTSRMATREAIDLAVGLGARLVIVNVLDARRLSRPGSHARVDQARTEREGALMELAGEARRSGVSTSFLVWSGEPANSIAAAAEAEHADLIVVGSRGLGGAGRMVLGSVSDEVVRTAPCPVVVVRSSHHPL